MSDDIVIEWRAKRRDANYLAGKDFKCNIWLEHQDGSKFYFRHAKLVNDWFWTPSLSQWSALHYVIHTEHCGIHIFNSLDVVKILVDIRK